MSEQWLGLHNPERHAEFAADGMVFCYPAYGGCDEWCSPERLCRCCLAAEVAALRAQVQAVRDAVGEERYNPWPHLRDWDDGWNKCREGVLDALGAGDE